MKYVVLSSFRGLFRKRHYWVVYDEDDGFYNGGWNWTKRGAHKDAKLYMDKINDGRFFR